MMKPRRAVFLAFFLCFVLSLPAMALAEEAEQDANVAKRKTAAEKAAAKISKTAQERAAPELGEVTFEHVLARPDDVRLNFEFAKRQVAQNGMLGAAATLERILILNPSLDPVRMFYAVVLFRLDNLTEAARELAALSRRDLPAPIRAEVKRYQKEIEKRKRRTHLSLRESLGWGFDSNRNAVPSSKERLFGNTRLPVSANDRARRDTHFLNITTVDIAQDLPSQAGHQLLGSFTYFLQEQALQNALSLSSYSYELGGIYKTPWFNVTPLFTASHVTLSHETFLRTQGGSVLVDRDFFNGRLNVFNLNKLEHQDYVDITENLAAHERKGNQYDLKQGMTIGLLPSMSLTAALGYTHKRAKLDFNAYDRITLEADHVWIWPKEQFLINGMTVGFDEYDEPDLAIADRERHDRSFRYSITYGAPLGTLLLPLKKILPGQIKDITATFTYEYYRAFSNITNYTYHNNKLQVLFTKRWEF